MSSLSLTARGCSLFHAKSATRLGVGTASRFGSSSSRHFNSGNDDCSSTDGQNAVILQAKFPAIHESFFNTALIKGSNLSSSPSSSDKLSSIFDWSAIID